MRAIVILASGGFRDVPTPMRNTNNSRPLTASHRRAHTTPTPVHISIKNG